MLITRETDYAIRIILYLADGELHSVKSLCAIGYVPQQFAYKIVKKLEAAKIIKIKRGAAGGCRLSCDLDELSLFDLLTALGEERYVNACMIPGFPCERRAANNMKCDVHNHLIAIQEKLDEMLKGAKMSALFTPCEEPAAE